MINFLTTATTTAATTTGSTNGAAQLLCGDASQIVILVGKVVSLFQIAIPIILVVIGLISLGKAVVAGKDDEVKKATSGLVKKIVFAAAIFFVVAIVKLVVGLVSKSTNDSMQAANCWTYIERPWDY